MTTYTYTLQLEQGIGYSGKRGDRAYVAEILGTDERYGFSRAFRDADQVERDHYGRARYTRTYTYELPPGLYEVSESGKRRYLLVWGKEGGVGRYNPPIERVEAMARLMSAGEPFEAARIATKPAPKSAAVEAAQVSS